MYVLILILESYKGKERGVRGDLSPIDCLLIYEVDYLNRMWVIGDAPSPNISNYNLINLIWVPNISIPIRIYKNRYSIRSRYGFHLSIKV